MTKLKIVSNNKVRANRENAKKSTGPRTVSGKEKVSGNALSHGLTAEKHVIIGESIDEFNTFKDSMFKVRTFWCVRGRNFHKACRAIMEIKEGRCH